MVSFWERLELLGWASGELVMFYFLTGVVVSWVYL